MKLAAVIILSALLLFLAFQVYTFQGRVSQVKADYASIKSELQSAEADQSKIQDELNYYLNPANLEKEIRARFNYISPGEKMIIIVPSGSSTTSTP